MLNKMSVIYGYAQYNNNIFFNHFFSFDYGFKRFYAIIPKLSGRRAK